jgi:diaminohydroxyphosphoribosylaminopyrimidine deaminase/5-amino-6-(5-phosphoribosylamino)uracil reductase
LILNGVKESVDDNLELIKSDFRVNLAAKVAEICFERNLESLIIEGGASILQQFIDANIWDEARIFTGKTSFKNGIKAPILDGKTIREETIENDQLEVIRNL